jgi:hypothetical protein
VITAKAASQIKTNGADIARSPIPINALYRKPTWRNPKQKTLTGSQKVPAEMASTSQLGTKSWERYNG